ncbi:MAG: hypothetical protein ACO3NL_07620 [Phycisphaerales bacterium]
MSEPSEMPYGKAIPKPTAGPLIAAFGVAMLFAGLVTNIAASVVGAAALLVGAARWFRDVMPEESLEPIEPTGGQTEVLPPPLPPRTAPSRRLVLPVEIHPYRAGIVGGLAGGVAMAAVAAAWGIVEHGSLWLPINLLAGAVNPSMASLDESQLAAFDGGWIAIASLIHVVLSIGTGLLFTVALPMMPRRPMLFGIVVAPVILSALSWGTMGIVNPALEEFISWPWFVGSQVAFGGVCGYFVNRFEKVSTMRDLDFAERIGIERSEGGAS